MVGTTDEAVSILKGAHVNVSAQRVAVLRYLMEHRTHPTADEIYRALSPDYPSLSLTTVYNTLWLLVDKGVVSAISIQRDIARFDIVTESHAHFLCRECGAIYDVEADIPRLKEAMKRFRPEKTEVYFSGICGSCAGLDH